MKLSTTICLIGILFVLSSCDTRTQLHHYQIQYAVEIYDPTPLTTLMNAEMAISRQQYGIAARNYLALAKLYQSVYLAKRALRIAILDGDLHSAVDAAQLWAVWMPYDAFAQYLATTLLMNAKQPKKTLPFLQNILLSHSKQTVKTLLMIVEQLPVEKSKLIFLDILKSLIKQHPKNAELLLSYAVIALDLGKNKLALTQIDQAIQLKPHWLEPIALRSQILMRQNKPNNALDYIKSQIINHPEQPELRAIYANLFNELKRIPAAKGQYQKLLDTSQRGEALIKLAQIAYKQNDNNQAIDYLKQALEIKAHAMQARFYLGVISQDANQDHEALKWYLEILTGSYYIEAQTRAAIIIAQQGKPQAALTLLDKLSLPSLAQLKKVLLTKAQILTNYNQPKKALSILNRGVALMPEDTDLLYNRSLVAEKLSLSKIAINDLRLIVTIKPNSSDALNALGYILANKTNRYQEALAYISKAFKLSPDNPAVLDSMGWVQYRLGNCVKSIKYLEKAYHLSKDAEIAAHLGEVLWISGEFDQAKKVWDAGLKESPKNKVLLETMKRFEIVNHLKH